MSTRTPLRQIQRSPRIASRLHQFRHFARCSIPGQSALYQTGEYDDISESGMLMVSRAKNRLPTGALVTVEFKLPGIETIFSRRARVARTAGDFELGLAFIDQTPTESRLFSERLRDYIRFLQSSVVKPSVSRWQRLTKKHSARLAMAFSALLILAGMGLVAYLGSDLHAKPQPKYHWGKW
jgi:hypothetical protein